MTTRTPLPPIRKPQIYITNAELLIELNNCKATFCSFTDPSYKTFDTIIADQSEITPELVQELKEARADKMSKAAKKELRLVKKAHQIKDHEWQVDPNSIPSDSIVFRVMTWDHIPKLDESELPKTVKKPNDIHAKVNFPPFKHYIFRNNELIEVGRSHWKDGLHNGYFSTDHGKITNKMGRMWLKLVERYGSKGNWRGYSYNDEMQSAALLQLTRFGMLFDESKSVNPFAYFTVMCQNAFTGVLNKEKRSQSIRDDLIIMSGNLPSMTRQIADEAAARAHLTANPGPKPEAKRGRPKGNTATTPKLEVKRGRPKKDAD